MQFSRIAALLAVMVASVSADVDVDSPCSGAGYECLTNNAGIAVCNGASWQLAAPCGGCPNACTWPAGGVYPPYCRC